MARTTHPAALPAPADTPAHWLTETVLQAHHMQLLALLSWFEALSAIQNELWDEWACRWAGGVPIDA
ncbi:MAG: hypothetical protein ABL916_04755 [Burkholderiaceae bacterium]